jgi:undecaprenyl pyrophosphate synthase
MDRRKIVAEMQSVRFDVCRGPGAPAREKVVAVGYEMQTGAATRRRGGKRVHGQLKEAEPAGVGDSAGALAANEARAHVDTTVTVLSAMDGREDIAQMTRRLAADVAVGSAALGALEVEKGASKIDEELVSAQLRGNPILQWSGL